MVSGVLPTPAGKQIRLVGDTHANAVWTASVIRALGAEGVDVVVQLGDFGWWPQKGFAKHVSKAAVVAGVTVCFLDGNHEHHEHLRFHTSFRNPAADPADPVEMYPSLWYLPRGCGWEWHKVRFRALRGAYSIDHGVRTPGYDLFPAEEAPTPADAQRAIAEGQEDRAQKVEADLYANPDAGPADVLLCHDYPALGYEL